MSPAQEDMAFFQADSNFVLTCLEGASFSIRYSFLLSLIVYYLLPFGDMRKPVSLLMDSISIMLCT